MTNLLAQIPFLNELCNFEREVSLVSCIKITFVPVRRELLVETDVPGDAMLLRHRKGGLQKEKMVQPQKLVLVEVLELVERLRQDADNMTSWISVRMTGEPVGDSCIGKEVHISHALFWDNALGTCTREVQGHWVRVSFGALLG